MQVTEKRGWRAVGGVDEGEDHLAAWAFSHAEVDGEAGGVEIEFAGAKKEVLVVATSVVSVVRVGVMQLGEIYVSGKVAEALLIGNRGRGGGWTFSRRTLLDEPIPLELLSPSGP